MGSVNRLAISSPDRVMGQAWELEELRLDTQEYLSCGDARPGMARCPEAARCTMAWKGKRGMQQVYDIEPETLAIKRDAAGEPVTKEHPAGGPKNMAVYRKDAWTKRHKVMFMPCYRFYPNRERWMSAPKGRPPDTVAIIAIEGDGKLVPMQETKEFIVGTDSNGRPVRNVRKVKVPRAVPFFERPAEFLVDRKMEMEIEDMVQHEADLQAGTIIRGLPAEDRPIELDAIRAAGRAAGEVAP